MTHPMCVKMCVYMRVEGRKGGGHRYVCIGLGVAGEIIYMEECQGPTTYSFISFPLFIFVFICVSNDQ